GGGGSESGGRGGWSDLRPSMFHSRSSILCPYGVVTLPSPTPASTRLAPALSAAWMRIRIVRPANWLRFTVAVAHAALSLVAAPSSSNTGVTVLPTTILTRKKSAGEELLRWAR